MKAIASLFVDAFIPLIVGSPCSADNNKSFSLKPFQSLYYGWFAEHTRGAECC